MNELMKLENLTHEGIMKALGLAGFGVSVRHSSSVRGAVSHATISKDGREVEGHVEGNDPRQALIEAYANFNGQVAQPAPEPEPVPVVTPVEEPEAPEVHED